MALKQYTVNSMWKPDLFKDYSECASAMCKWINVIVDIKQSQNLKEYK